MHIGASGTEKLRRFIDRTNQTLERVLPEQRLFLKSDRQTRFIRLRPTTQFTALAGAGVLVGWAIIATSILLMDTIGSGNVRHQAEREQVLYEARLNEMAAQRDARAAEAREAQERFNIALERVSRMQSLLLESEDRRKELETGLDVVQNTMRKVIAERNEARDRVARLTLALNEESGAAEDDAARLQDVEDALAFLSEALGRTSEERDLMIAEVAQAKQQIEHVEMEKRLIEDRNKRIFSQLEQAVEMSMEPLAKVFRDVGLPPERILSEVRQGYASETAALRPLTISTKGDLEPDATELRAQDIMAGLQRINQFRIAAEKAPFAEPVASGVRMTSGFGSRRDPKTGASRMHNGVDWAGRRGTPIYATSDGVVTHAGWQGGFGRLVKIEHAFGIETYYAHLNAVHVTEGQRVSRGDRIGDMGTTGRSTGVHLHYEVRIDGKPINPMSYVKAARNVF